MTKNIINCGVDLDGVIANYVKRFSQLCNQIHGAKCHVIEDLDEVKHWDWHRWYPIKENEVAYIWKHIVETRDFWLSLDLLNRGQWEYFIDKIGKNNSINTYFITTREETLGMTATKQSAMWLEMHSWKQPFVIKAKNKEKFIEDLNIEFFIDDKAENLIDIKKHNPTCKIYAQDAPYNLTALENSHIEYKRVRGLRQFADDIIQELYNRDYKNTWK